MADHTPPPPADSPDSTSFISNAQLSRQLAHQLNLEQRVATQVVDTLSEIIRHHLCFGTSVNINRLGTLSVTHKSRRPVEFKPSDTLRSMLPTAQELKDDTSSKRH